MLCLLRPNKEKPTTPVAGDLLLRRSRCFHWSPCVPASDLNSLDSSLFAGSFSTSSSRTVVFRATPEKSLKLPPINLFLAGKKFQNPY
ncbi:hypothetical protein U1Q18_005598 [Sarracenia purpurea var. burkii]